MIPAQIDIEQIVADLRAWGWLDYKIEVACGLGAGYIAQVRCGNIRNPAYSKAARLFNFWEDQQQLLHLQTRLTSATSA